jgi:hypothetical protein
LAPRYIGPFTITALRGEVAYELALPEKLSKVHNVFHVSQLKKCFNKPEEEDLKTSLDSIEVQEDLTYEEYPIKILDEQVRITRRNVIKFCKVKFNGATTLRKKRHGSGKMPSGRSFQIFSLRPNLGVEIPCKGGRIVTSRFFLLAEFFLGKGCCSRIK